MRRPLALAVAVTALALLPACKQGVSEAEREVVRRWLSCEACTGAERAAVEALGPGAITLLVEPLDPDSRGGRVFRQTVEADLLGSYSTLPAPPTDAATYVRAFLGNALARAQIRSAASLGDLGAVAEINRALEERAARGLRNDVVSALESALARATLGLVPAVSNVVVIPGNLELEVGRTVTLSAALSDASGSPVAGQGVTWSFAGPSISTLDAAGIYTAVAPGVDTVIATHAATGTEGRAVVTTVAPSPLPTLFVISGDLQSGPVGSRLGAPLVIEARRPDGTAATGVPIVWRVSSGEGALGSPDYTTDVDGRAQATWWLGARAGAQRVQVTGPRNTPVLFRATGLPHAGGLAITGVVLGDGDGVAGAVVSRSDGASTVTDANGEFSFTVPPGSYTLTATVTPPYILPDPTRTVTVGPDEPRAALWYQAYRTLGAVAGALFMDVNPRNNVFDGSPQEPHLARAGVTITLERPDGSVGATVTDANGDFSFPGVPAGVYTLRLDPNDAALPTGVSFGGIATMVQVAVSPGDTTRIYFPFDPS